jgi:CcmD family protein
MRTTRLFLACCSILLLAASTIASQPPGQEGFVPVTPETAVEQLPAAPLLIVAYAFVWVALLVYVWSIWRRLEKVEREMHALEQRGSGTRGGR